MHAFLKYVAQSDLMTLPGQTMHGLAIATPNQSLKLLYAEVRIYSLVSRCQTASFFTFIWDFPPPQNGKSLAKRDYIATRVVSLLYTTISVVIALVKLHYTHAR